MGETKIIGYEQVKVEDIKPNEYNPNEMTAGMMDHLVKEIKRSGFLQPVLLNQNKIIIDGEHRWLAAKQCELKEIPAVLIELSDSDAKITTINMNKIKGELNPHKFAELLSDLKTDIETDEIIKTFNLSIDEINTYAELLEVPETKIEKLIPKEKHRADVSCPECGHKFTI
jgi:ParB/RepB/Spo0J family partition protein|tara:strand:+ start:13260 stop:13772 length:513 start_codon:yes stop_codon:yes gene_type:complete